MLEAFGTAVSTKNTAARISLSLCLLAAFVPAHAQKPAGLPPDYPSKPVRVIIGTAPGGSTDFLGRTVLGKVAEKWGATFVNENMASVAGGSISLDAALKSPADGYTLLVTSGSTFQNAMFIQKVSYDVRKVFAPVVQFTNSPLVMGVNALLPVSNIKELIAYAKANPGKLNVAVSGIGSSAHLTIELFKHMTGTNMVSVPYKGVGPSVADTIAGRTHVTLGTSVALLPHVRSGKLKLLGITSPKRIPSLPDVPTIAEMGVPGFGYVGWIGTVARAGTDSAIVNAINHDAVEVIRSPDIQKLLARDGSDPAYSTPEEYRQVIADALDRAEKLIKEQGLKFN